MTLPTATKPHTISEVTYTLTYDYHLTAVSDGNISASFCL